MLDDAGACLGSLRRWLARSAERAERAGPTARTGCAGGAGRTGRMAGSRRTSLSAIALLLPASIALGDTLVLRTAVRAQRDDGVVLLREVAELRGAELSKFGDVVVATVPVGAPPREIAMDDIRRRLEQAGANWAKIDLEGRRVVVRPRIADAFGTPALNAPASVVPTSRDRGDSSASAGSADSESTRARADGAPAADAFGGTEETAGANAASARQLPTKRGGARSTGEPVLAAAVLEEQSVRALVAAAMTRALDESPDDVRLRFDGLDASTLAENPPGVRLEIDPVGALDADRAEFAVRWWRDGKVERRSNLSVLPEIARSATVASRDLRKGDRPDPTELQTSLCWVRPSERHRVVRASAIAGRAMGATLRANEPLLEQHLERPLLVRRGDRIVVRTTVGSLAVSVDAIAKTDGREGDVIECVRQGSQSRRDRNAITVVVTGRGEAVVRGDRDNASTM